MEQVCSACLMEKGDEVEVANPSSAEVSRGEVMCEDGGGHWLGLS